MTLAAKINKETFDALNDTLKGEYIEKDGSYLVDIKPIDGFALENVDGLKTALGTTRTERDTAITAAAAFKGLDVDEAKKAIEKLKEYQNFDPDQKIAEGIKAQKDALITEHNKAMEVKETKISTLTGQLESKLIDVDALAAIEKHEGNSSLLLGLIKNQTRMKEVNGQFIAEVIDGAGNARIGNTQGDLMTMDQLVMEMKEKTEYAGAFKGTGSSGSGTKPGGSGEQTTTTSPKGQKVVDANDQNGLNANLEDIASGKTTVQFDN